MVIKIPFITSGKVDCLDLPVLEFEKFVNKERISQGAFGVVITADLEKNSWEIEKLEIPGVSGLCFIH